MEKYLVNYYLPTLFDIDPKNKVSLLTIYKSINLLASLYT